MTCRAVSWAVANALLWSGAGAATVLAVERWRAEPPTLADLADDALARMDGLGLSPEQRASLVRIRDEWRQGVLTDEAAWQARFADAAADADRRIEALLTADQARRWRELAVGAGSK